MMMDSMMISKLQLSESKTFLADVVVTQFATFRNLILLDK